ncbi:DUF2273 domain-containing protein [Pseudoclavibacter chungangensis]|uniref:DUF2273 domain-containing protein n=1 Tax=Pseudoclavibacter chungangensis TaxID=587635 RepID=A0A7J5BNC0_9MICO|nr:DUF2273 domain-containing protein [Pseudoclavibacter chungangensis]KAB1653617.1 DUF2273 domain-containing protein [Pseudoclavibacter chungangensis]NYJ68723.1 putative membrane protein [Pseudoclavibacter chungangensis]
MSTTAFGTLVGVLLALAALQFGFWGFLLAAVFAIIGGLVGRFASGKLDLRAIVNAFTGRRTS